LRLLANGLQEQGDTSSIGAPNGKKHDLFFTAELFV